MPLTSAERVRLKIADPPTLGAGAGVGDGTAVTFALPHRNLTSGTAYLATTNGWSATGATFDPTGAVTFAARISAGSAFRVTYVYSVFSDAEVDEFLTTGGSIIGASIEAAQSLAFDGVKRASWSAPDGSSYNDTAAQQHIMALLRELHDEQADEAIAGGSSASWSLDQGSY